MHDDDGYARFFTYLNLFVFSMMMLVLATTSSLLFVGWEGVGLCSYLLIGFWYERKAAPTPARRRSSSTASATSASLSACHADLRHASAPSTSTTVVRQGRRPSVASRRRLTWSSRSCLFIGASGKSAQFPLYVWLPDAMEGPTPVSALIHAATMVTAGVYMVARCHALFELAPHGADDRRAASARSPRSSPPPSRSCRPTSSASSPTPPSASSASCSWASGSARTRAGIFHLVTHAFFKALLFLGAGQRDARARRRAGHAQDGRPRPAHDDHHRDVPDRRLRPRRLPAARRLLLQGRDPRRGFHEHRLRARGRSWWPARS